MGYYNEGTIRCFQPDSNHETLYIQADWWAKDLTDILAAAQKHFAEYGHEDLKFEDLAIVPQHIHTRCLGYDRYDSMDYENFLLITLTTDRNG